MRFDKALGGGSLLDMGCYAVSIVRGVLRRGAGRSAWASFDIDPESGVDLSAAALLEFSGGRDRAGLAPRSRLTGQGTYQVIGTKGTIDVPRAFIPGMGSRVAEGLVIVVDPDGRRTETSFEPADQYRLMAEAFADAVLSGQARSPTRREDAVDNMRVARRHRRLGARAEGAWRSNST